MSQKFYLETSVIRSRLFGHSSIYSLLKNKLQNQICITSKFVKMEFGRNFVCDLMEFYFVLKKHETISDAIKYWNEEYRTRKIKNINFGYAESLTGIDDNDIGLALLKFRTFIKNIIIAFNHLINRFDKNDCNCVKANFELNCKFCDSSDEIEQSFVDFYRAFNPDCSDNCKVADLLCKNNTVLSKVMGYSSKNETLDKQKKYLTNIWDDNRKISCETCKIVGDIIISLECPEYATLLSIDKIFEDLCKSLNLKYEIIDSVRKITPIGETLKEIKNNN